MKTALASLIIFAGTMQAAFNSTAQWEVRTTGSDTNGGGFDSGVASPGTDRSQQDAVFQAYADIVIGGTTTQITSTGHPFDSTSPGNFINVTGGAGCTVQWLEILSVSGATATVDKSAGTAASTCTGNLGGSLATPAKAAALVASGNTVNVKAGTYTFTTSLSLSISSTFWIGFQATHKDGGTKPLFTTSTNNVHIWVSANGQQINNTDSFTVINNFEFSSTGGATGTEALHAASALWSRLDLMNDYIHDFTGTKGCINGDQGTDWDFAELWVFSTEIKGCTSATAAITNSGATSFLNSYIHNNTGDGFRNTSANSGNVSIGYGTVCSGSIFASNVVGINLSSTSDSPNARRLEAYNCTFANNSSDGVHSVKYSDGGSTDIDPYQGTTPYRIMNCIFYGNGGWGVNFAAGIPMALNQNNAYGSNTSGARNNIVTGTNDATLTADPFTSAAGGDYSLNSNVGGGAACRGAGYPGVFPGATTTAYLDIGAVQHQASAGGSGQAGYISH